MISLEMLYFDRVITAARGFIIIIKELIVIDNNIIKDLLSIIKESKFTPEIQYNFRMFLFHLFQIITRALIVKPRSA